MNHLVRTTAFALSVLTLLTTLQAEGMERRDRELLMKGRRLTAEEAAQLESTIAKKVDDLESRLQLLGYYFHKLYESPDAMKSQQAIVLWLIDRHPESPVLVSPETRIDMILNAEGYSAAAELWRAKVKTHNTNAKIIGNAAGFFLLSEAAEAEKLLKKAQKLEPDSAEWSLGLGHLHLLKLQRAKADAKADLAAKALVQFERAMKQIDKKDVYYHLDKLAKAAFEANDDQKAEKYAKQLLEINDETEKNWHSGNAVHHANLILGRLALRNGDIAGAKEYLLKAGATSGSPQLNSAGPNMSLAQELLDKGERDAVLEYFTPCGKFWDRDKLKEWTALVKNGQTPEFGANLVY